MIETAPFEPEAAVLAEFDAAIDALIDYHRNVAKSIWPRGTVLRCPTCDRIETATVGQIAHYLAHGMPTCHGETMRIGDPETN